MPFVFEDQPQDSRFVFEDEGNRFVFEDEPKKKSVLDRIGAFVGTSAPELESSNMPEGSLKTVGEAAATLGTGATSWIPAGLQMFSGVMGGNDYRTLNERVKAAQDIQESLTYRPKGEEAKKIVETVVTPITKAAELGERGGQYFDENGHPILGAASRFAGEAAPFLVPGVVKGAKGGARLVRSQVPRGLDIFTPGEMPTLRPVAVPAEVMPTRGKLVGEPYGPEALKRPVKMEPSQLALTGEAQKTLPYPDYAGEGFVFDDAPILPDLLRKDGKPFMNEAGARNAIKREGVAGYEPVEVDGGWVARPTQPAGREFRPENAPPVDELGRLRAQVKAEDAARANGTFVQPETAPIPKPSPAPIVQPGTDAGAVLPLVEVPRTKPTRKGPENLVTYLQKNGFVRLGDYSDMGGDAWERAHGYRRKDRSREMGDVAAVSRKDGKWAMDEAATNLNAEGWRHPSGEEWTPNSLFDVLSEKGKGRNIFSPEKMDDIIERKLRRETNAWADEQAAIATGKIDTGRIEKSREDLAAEIIEAAKEQGEILRPDEALAEVDAFIAAGKKPTGMVSEGKRGYDEVHTSSEGGVPYPSIGKGKEYAPEPPDQFPRLSDAIGPEPPSVERPPEHRRILAAVKDRPWNWTADDLMDLRPSERNAKLEKIWGPEEDFQKWVDGEGPDTRRHRAAYDWAADLDHAIREGDKDEVEGFLQHIQKRLKPQDYYAYEEIQNPRGNAPVSGTANRAGAGEVPEAGRTGPSAISPRPHQENIPGVSGRESVALTPSPGAVGRYPTAASRIPSAEQQSLFEKRKKYFQENGTLEGFSEAQTFDLTNPETEIARGPLSKKNMTPTGEIPGTEKPAVTLTAGIDPTQIGPALKGIKEGISGSMVGKAARGLGQEIHSPEVVLSREPAGKIIYETADRADIAKNQFLSKEGKEFETRMKEAAVKPDTDASSRVGAALDGKIDPKTLSAGERKAFDFFKEKFHFLIQEAGKSAAGDQATYIQALNLANRKVKPMEKVADLSAGQRNHYKGLTTPAERMAYLHEKWKEAQPENIVKAYDILSRELKNYLPHIFDRETLVDMFKTEASAVANNLRTQTNPSTVTQLKNRLAELEVAIQTVQGGGFVKYEALPRNVRFKFFETRKGKEGYSFDAAKAYQTYLVGIARKMFDEPAMKSMAREYENLSPELKPYADWFMRRFAGIEKKNRPLDNFANAVASFQWIRTLGFNPRSAMVNLSQRLNTVAEVGVKYSAKGERFAFTDEGKALFDSTGLAKEVPQVLYEGGAPSMEKLRSVAGWMFNQVELGNRRHAFLSAYLEAIEKRKMAPEAAVRYAENIVHKTQFRYGRVGMPKIMSSPLGRVGLQFMSYPIKQIELLTDWAKHDPMKLVKYLAMAEGANYTLQQFLDTDMSNAIGIGLNMGEALNVLKDASKGDLQEAWRHARLALQPGSGLLPSGFGPTVTGAGKVISAIPEGKVGATLVRELTPVMARRGIQAVQAVQGERGGKYPLLSTSGRPTAKLTAGELIQRTIGPRTETEHKASLDYERRVSLENQRQGIQRDIIDKFINGDIAGARKLARSSGIVPTMKQIEDEKIKRRFTREEIGRSKATLTKPREYQMRKEGRVIY